MMPIKEVLSPARQNSVQRRGFFGALAITFLILLLHFPFEGYDNEDLVTTHRGYGTCPSLGADGLRTMTAEQFRQYGEDMKRCSDSMELQDKPLSEWRSKAPIVEWFGSLVHSLIALIFTISIGGLWLWVFRTHDDN